MKVNIGKRLRDFRSDRNISLRILAKQTGISMDHLGRIERGESKNPRMKTMMKIAQALNVAVGEFWS